MYKIIGGDKKEYGPVGAEELRHWIAEGRVNSQTQVLVEGSTEWKQLSEFPEFAEALRCSGTPLPTTPANFPPLDSEAFANEILARPAQLQIGRCLSLSLNLLRANLGLLFGAVAIVWVINLGSHFIPLGGIAYWVLRGVLYGGLYVVFLRRIRGQPASVGDVFAGFSLAFVQLLLAGFITGLLSWIGFVCCLVLPGLYLFVAWIFSVPLVADKRLEFWSAMELSRKIVTRVWFQVFGLLVVSFLPFMLTYILFSVKMSFAAIPAIQELLASGQPDFHRMMQAMMPILKTSLWMVMLVNLMLLLNLPFAVGALMYAYESLFGTRTPSTA